MGKKIISIIGSTGSIGRQTLDVLREQEDLFSIFALSANKNIDLLFEQSTKWKPEFAILNTAIDNQKLMEMAKKFKSISVKLLIEEDPSNQSRIREVFLSKKIDCIIVGSYGFEGLKHSLLSVEQCKVLCIANKESIICLWNIIEKKAKECNTKIIPLDSEHNTIFQILDAFNNKKPRSLVLTASGGAVRDYDINHMKSLNFAEIVKHPSWSMGSYISVNSSTMMNKVMEVIEAYYLFNTSNISIVAHQESAVHAIVEIFDGFYISGISFPDMKTHINVSINWPDNIKLLSTKKINFAKLGNLSFSEIDKIKYPLVELAYDFLENPQNCYAIIINAANEIAVDYFELNKICFTDIETVIKKTIDNSSYCAINSLKDAVELNDRSRNIAKSICDKF